MKKSAALQEEEDIIRRRFLTQTAVVTTTGPPFAKLVESVRQLGDGSGAGYKGNGSEAEVSDGVVGTVLSDLYGIEAYINKLGMMMGAYKKEQDVYREKHAELQSSISGCVSSIEACKSELVEARRQMAQAKEYEQVKQQIVKIPARSMTLLEAEGVKKEIEELKKERTAVEDQTSAKLSQFRSILQTIERVDGELASISAATTKGMGTVQTADKIIMDEDIDIEM